MPDPGRSAGGYAELAQELVNAEPVPAGTAATVYALLALNETVRDFLNAALAEDDG